MKKLLSIGASLMLALTVAMLPSCNMSIEGMDMPFEFTRVN